MTFVRWLGGEREGPRPADPVVERSPIAGQTYQTAVGVQRTGAPGSGPPAAAVASLRRAPGTLGRASLSYRGHPRYGPRSYVSATPDPTPPRDRPAG